MPATVQGACDSSSQPSPARSKPHARVNVATTRSTRVQLYETGRITRLEQHGWLTAAGAHGMHALSVHVDHRGGRAGYRRAARRDPMN